MANLDKLSREELVARQQEIMGKRAEAETKFRDQALEVQFALDKLDAKERFGSLSAADRAALAELDAEAAAQPVEE